MSKALYITLCLITGFICYTVAQKKKLGYSFIWFLVGAMFPVFGAIAIAAVSKFITDRRKGLPK